MVTDTYAPARNGVAVWSSMTVRELRKRGLDVEVLTYAHDRRPKGEPGMYELPAWFGLEDDFKIAPILSGLPDEVERGAWDIVHVHHPILLGPEGVRVGRRCGAKVIFTCHSVYTDYLDEYYWGVGKFMAGMLERRIGRFINGCDVALAPSTHVAEWMRADCRVTTGIELMEAPSDTTRVPPVPREEARAQLSLGEERVALYVGRLAEEKRLDELLDEFEIASRRVPNAVLALAGEGLVGPHLVRRAERRGLHERFRLLSALNGTQLGLWYSAADINVSASRSETGPLTVVEAMSCGTPTVALRAPGFEDRVEDGVNGLLAEDRPGALGDAIARVLADEELRARLSHGASARAPRYSTDAVCDRLVGMYERVLA
jgi:1,2-diacylglycerol 3-alpha-glucosyltransferase